MQCKCGAFVNPGDQFCGDCGSPVQAQAAPVPPPAAPIYSGVATPAAAATSGDYGRPAQRGAYAAEISRQNPACLVFLVDRSGSMDEDIGGGVGQKKKQVVADAINRLLYNTVLRCAKEDGVRPYFDVGVWCYGGAGEVTTPFGPNLVSIRDLADSPKRSEVRRRRVPDGAGGVYEEEFQMPVWFDPESYGNTPMATAFRAALDPLRNWVARQSASFPPIVLNLTDGAYTDANPASVAYEMMQLGTSDGSVLIFNCHIAPQSGMTVPFPGDASAAALTGLARELYDISSPLPTSMARAAEAKGYRMEPGARGYAFNADQVTLIDFLDIGTRAVQDRLERAF